MGLIIKNGVIFDIICGHVNKVFVNGDSSAITRIELPLEATYHLGNDLYDNFPNLLEIAADPQSTAYYTFDGALYSKRGSLVAVPLGKHSLILSTKLNHIYPHVFFRHRKLLNIYLEAPSEDYRIFCGCLIDRRTEQICFAANPERRLCIFEETSGVSPDVFTLDLSSCIIHPGNPNFKLEGGILTENGKVRYLFGRPSSFIPLSVTEISFYQLHKLFQGGRFVRAAIGHPVYLMEYGSLLNTVRREIVYIGSTVKSCTLPDDYCFAPDCFEDAHDLEEISVPASLRIPDRAPSRSFRITLRLPNGGKLCAEGDLKSVLSIFKSREAEVKPGTETIYLDLLLSGWRPDRSQYRNVTVSVFQMLIRVIDDHDLNRLRRVILDGRFITKRNYRRIVRHALRSNHFDMVEMLHEAKSGGIPPRLEIG